MDSSCLFVVPEGKKGYEGRSEKAEVLNVPLHKI